MRILSITAQKPDSTGSGVYLTELVKEFALRGITCNAIAPGFIKTDMTDVLSDSVKEKILENIPLKRFGQPEEVAKLAVFLAENRYITGQVMNIDGGMVMN